MARSSHPRGNSAVPRGESHYRFPANAFGRTAEAVDAPIQIRYPTSRAMLWPLLGLGLPIAGVTALIILAIGSKDSSMPTWSSLGLSLGLAAIGSSMVVVAVWGFTRMTNYAVELTDSGVTEIQRGASLGPGSRRTVRWDDLESAELAGPVSRAIWIRVKRPGFGLLLTLDQARALLSDRRCPIRNGIGSDVLARLANAPGES